MKPLLRLGLTLGLLGCLSLTACVRSANYTQEETRIEPDYAAEPTDDNDFSDDDVFVDEEDFSMTEEASLFDEGESLIAEEDSFSEEGESSIAEEDSFLDEGESSIALKMPSNDQIKQLEESGLPTVLPTNLPAGFELTDFKSEFSSFGVFYDATYTGDNNCKFTVSGATGGWGALGPVQQWMVQTPLFGEVVLEEHDWEDGPNSLSASVTPSPELGKAVIAAYPNAGYLFGFSCEYTTYGHEQAADILKSMEIIQ